MVESLMYALQRLSFLSLSQTHTFQSAMQLFIGLLDKVMLRPSYGTSIVGRREECEGWDLMAKS
ncbi:CLUMA_CG012328, isoform A [Clunio marinus]|uniref:CLUMA_CG012328, isoform A n=1 Tax=Clunio marinus TaxID=568069 RepID=A0A1J1IGJ3_9DIPT|nr:CLUMA_CG012328, isoform A [Clunio marinus]